MTNATQFPLNSREWAKWLESRIATVERSVNPTATRIANEIAAKLLYENGGPGDGDTYQIFTPIGAPIPWLTDTLPPGFVELNGQLLSRNAYPALYAVYGTKYGAGDGSTTFGTPNMAGRTFIGRDPADTTMDATGETGGEKTHTLTIAEMPAHDHGGSTGNSPITAAGGGTNFSVNDGASGSNYMRAGSDSAGRYASTISGSSHSHSITSQGGTTAHNNMPPFMVSRWITRYQDVVVPPTTIPYSVAATPDTLALRDSSGRTQVETPAVAADAANKGYVDTQDATTLTTANSYTDTKVLAAGVSAPTPNTVVRRDAAGRTQMVDPAAPQDVATKAYVDAASSGGAPGTPLPTPSTTVKRDAAGRAQFVDPIALQDAATKNSQDTGDAATLASAKSYTDTQDGLALKKASNLSDLANVATARTNLGLTTVATTAGASAATPSTVVVRDAAGRAQFVDPSAAQDAATKNYVDTKVAAGAPPTGAAGGDLTGTYPNPQIAAGVIVDADVAAANKDGLATVPSMRTLGTGATQAAAGNHTHPAPGNVTDGDKGDISVTSGVWTIDPLVVTDAKVAAANKDGAAATPSMRTLGTGATQAAAGNDARFSDSRPPNGTAGGDLSGTYPNPQIAAGVIVDADVNAANKDGLAAVPSMRTIGTGAQQAMAGNRALNTITAPTGDLSMAGFKITNVAQPAAAQDAATKKYVDDSIVAGGAGTPLPTPSTNMARDAAGRSQVEAPSAAKDIANKTFVETGDSSTLTSAKQYADGPTLYSLASIATVGFVSNDRAISDSTSHTRFSFSAGPGELTGMVYSPVRVLNEYTISVTTGSAYGLTIKAEDARSTDINRFSMPADLFLSPGEAASFVYASPRWILKSTADVGASATTPNTLVLRDAAGRAQVVDPSVAADIATKNYVDTQNNLDLKKASNLSDLANVATARTNLGLTSSATTAAAVAATPNTLALRDAAGRAQMVDPIANQDIATKKYVDDSIVAGGAGTPNPTPSTNMARDAAGRSQVEAPSAAKDITNKGYVDTFATPTGTVSMFAGATAPSGYLLCDGAAVSRTGATAALFAAIGTAYGAGDGSTTFNVPNFKGRGPMGLSGTADFSTLGQQGGERLHTLTVAEMPSHNHGGAAGNTQIEATMTIAFATSNPTSSGNMGRGNATNPVTNPVNGTTHSHTIPSQGNGDPFNVLDPYLTVNFIIKT